MKDPVALIKTILGEDFFDVLAKSEITGGIVKLNTQTATDPEEIATALKIVPRAILSFLFSNLKSKKVGDPIDLVLPFAGNAKLQGNKLSPDNYTGEIIQDGKVLIRFQYRSLPSIGLIIMSSLELYDESQLDEIKHNSQHKCDNSQDIQSIIDERVKLYSIINGVVDRKLAEKEAIQELLKERLTQSILAAPVEQVNMENKNKLKAFLDNVKQKHEVKLGKSEIHCPDCKTSLYDGGDKIKLCICYGEFMNKNIKIEKSEDGKVKLNFPKSFDKFNIEMLIEALKNNK